MTCRQAVPGVIVCGPDDSFLRKRYLRCPMCECRTETVVRYELWYGSTVHCLRCGDSWCDGELHPRPFSPGWRRKSIARGRRLWDRATHGPAPSLHDMDPSGFPGDHVTYVEDAATTGRVL